MRSAGCVINDFADRNFDGSVERTKNRPFARGLVSKTEAILLTVILCLLAALCMTPLNLLTWVMSVPALFLAMTYPLPNVFSRCRSFIWGWRFLSGFRWRLPPSAAACLLRRG